MYKEALRLRGVDAGVVRPPQRQMTSEEIEELRQGMTALKFI
jgi:dihydrodipicolinate synthase/N-acetylneuraminate lyase